MATIGMSVRLARQEYESRFESLPQQLEKGHTTLKSEIQSKHTTTITRRHHLLSILAIFFILFLFTFYRASQHPSQGRILLQFISEKIKQELNMNTDFEPFQTVIQLEMFILIEGGSYNPCR